MAPEASTTESVQPTDVWPNEFDTALQTNLDGTYLTNSTTPNNMPPKTTSDILDLTPKSIIDTVVATSSSSRGTASQLKDITSILQIINKQIQKDTISLLDNRRYLIEIEKLKGIEQDLEASLETGGLIDNKLAQSPETLAVLRELGEFFFSHVQSLSQINQTILQSLKADVRWGLLDIKRSSTRRELRRAAEQLEMTLWQTRPAILGLALAIRVGASQEETSSKLREELKRKDEHIAYVARRSASLYSALVFNY